jgi:hypothetical protein
MPEDENPQVVQRPEPDSGAIYSDPVHGESETLDEEAIDESPTGGRLLLFLAIFLGIAIVAAGAIYWVQARGFPMVAINPPDESDKDPLGKQGSLVPVSQDFLHVTSIALGTPRLTIVNGKRLAEGDWLVVKTPGGDGSVRVISIQDGLVRFKHGRETLEAHLQVTQSPSPPH